MKKLAALLLALCMVFALAVPAYAAGEKTLKVWVADAVVDFTKAQIDAFMADHPEYADYAVTVEPVGEGDAASNMLTDVEAGEGGIEPALIQVAQQSCKKRNIPCAADLVQRHV